MHPVVFTVLAAALAVGLLFWGFYSLKRKRLIENVPTSKVKGVFLGLNEVKGRARREKPVTSFLAEEACVYYRFEVSEHYSRTVTYTDSKGRTRTRTESGWKSIDTGQRRPAFYLHDRTGSILVRPRGAEIDCGRIFHHTCGPADPFYYGKGPPGSVMDSTFRRRFEEWAIRQNQRVYVMGVARERKDKVAPVIARSRDAEMYLISTQSERQLTSGYGWGAGAKLVVGAIAAFAFPIGLRLEGSTFERAFQTQLPLCLAVAAAYGGAILLYYLVLVYNGLVSVRERMEMARSMIEIQLRRRHTLIPRLVACVEGAAGHETGVQERLAQLRTEGTRPGDDDEVAARQGAALRQVVAIAEAYPALGTDGNFAQLQRELVDTEDRIALAREFYNGSVTALNIRVETMPDALVAAVTRFETGDLFAARGFERTPVTISLERDSNKEP